MKKYFTEEERKAANSKAALKWYYKNREKVLASKKEYWLKNKESEIKRHQKYTKTPMGRASCLVQAYKREDIKYNRGENDLSARWVVDNIFSKPCVYCGETDWTKMGCNRLDNSKPHTMDNVEPCCGKCNLLLQQKNRDKLGRYKS